MASSAYLSNGMCGLSRHPRIERIVQEQVCKERADDPTLRGSRCARHDAAVLHLHRRLQPALDVEQHPRAVRMMTNRLEQQLPIDTVEVTFDVYVEHPVVAPAALTSLAHGIDRRFGRACSHKSRCGTPAPDTAPSSVG